MIICTLHYLSFFQVIFCRQGDYKRLKVIDTKIGVAALNYYFKIFKTMIFCWLKVKNEAYLDNVEFLIELALKYIVI